MKVRLTQQSRLQELHRIYDEVPTMPCKGCGECCGLIQTYNTEKWNIRNYVISHGIPSGTFFTQYPKNPNTYVCPFKNSENKCSIYPIRPLICRLFGVTPDMKCRNGCVPSRMLTQQEAVKFHRRMIHLDKL